MLEMNEAIAQLEQALALAKSMRIAAKSAQALPADTGSQAALNQSLSYLKMPGLLASAPAGIAILSPKALRLASGGESIALMSGKNTDISTGSSFTVAASDTVSLFAENAGMRLFAGGGKVEIQAQDDKMALSASQDVTLTSAEGCVKIDASQQLILSCGGAYIKLSGGNIELGCPGNIVLKSTNLQEGGPATLETSPLTFAPGYSGVFTVRDQQTGEAMPFTRYKATTAEGETFTGVTDAEGKTVPLHSAMPGNMTIQFPDVLSEGQYQAVDPATGQPVAGCAYYLLAEDGESLSGFTDDHGMTGRLTTHRPSTVEVFWGEEALAKMAGDKSNA